jgi:hypothetical protein
MIKNGILRNFSSLDYTKTRLINFNQNRNMHILTAILCNVLILGGYLPIIGMFTGVFKIISGIMSMRNPETLEISDKMRKYLYETKIQHNGLAHASRGICEISGLGIVCLPYDIYVTYKRSQINISVDDIISTANE